MKKIGIIILIALLIWPSIEVSAKTLRDIKNDLEAAEKKLKDNKQKQVETEAEMKEVQAEVHENLVEVDSILKNIAYLTQEIEDYDQKIDLKEAEIKKLVNFVQKTEGNNAYLEYVFNAEDFSELVYRTAVAEQLSKYNSELIDEYNKMIAEKTSSKNDLEKKQEELVVRRNNLESEYKKLSKSLRTIEDAEPTIEEDIKLQRETYEFYVKLGCKLDDDIKVCGQKLLPPSTALFRPLESGYLNYAWGNRCYWLRGKQVCDFHKGMDLTKSGLSVPVYAAGYGRVVGVVERPNAWSCGGQVIFISHNVRGQYYTTIYMHLRKIFVKKGDIVDKNTVIAYMGGSPSIETWDTCSSGQHLHFGLSEGMFTTWAKAKSTLINPATVINFPKLHNSWNNRTTAFD